MNNLENISDYTNKGPFKNIAWFAGSVITIIIAIVHQHATKDSQELPGGRVGAFGQRLNVLGNYLSTARCINCTSALICKTKRSHKKEINNKKGNQ